MAFSFFTIQSPTQGIYKEKGSKFLAFAFPVLSESEAKEKIDELKKKYFDARHHCFAYVLGADKTKFRGYDDGEPNHSASDPILGQIRSRNLTNVVVIVVRYFGGVKLGVGGLMQAYKAAAEDALNHASIIEIEVTTAIEFHFDYGRTPEVMRLVKEFEMKIIDQSFGEACVLKAQMKLRVQQAFQNHIAQMNSIGLRVVQEEER
ncbi:MAG: YigZ family protein [Bacteroidetes bacterium]|nr:YigZ family protein [Bacteroidota bacterium]